jgi:hypothetical protein
LKLNRLRYRKKIRRRQKTLTSGLRFETRSVDLSFVPVMPGGKPPPKAAAMAAALGIYNSKKNNSEKLF